MKRIFIAAAVASASLFASCAHEGPTADQVGDQFRRGASGEGQLGPIDRSDDPYVRPRGSAPSQP